MNLTWFWYLNYTFWLFAHTLNGTAQWVTFYCWQRTTIYYAFITFSADSIFNPFEAPLSPFSLFCCDKSHVNLVLYAHTLERIFLLKERMLLHRDRGREGNDTHYNEYPHQLWLFSTHLFTLVASSFIQKILFLIKIIYSFIQECYAM